jgi:hypothetical protein
LLTLINILVQEYNRLWRCQQNKMEAGLRPPNEQKKNKNLEFTSQSRYNVDHSSLQLQDNNFMQGFPDYGVCVHIARLLVSSPHAGQFQKHRHFPNAWLSYEIQTKPHFPKLKTLCHNKACDSPNCIQRQIVSKPWQKKLVTQYPMFRHHSIAS